MGVDIGYKGSTGIGVAVAYSVKDRRELCHIAIVDDVHIPYIPGLLAYREAPLMIIAIEELSTRCIKPDVAMVNGHGVAHPRRLGIASHIGIVLDIPSIGVAKSLLYGAVIDKGVVKAIAVDNNIVGYVLENENNKKIYVSVGHKISPENALDIVISTWNKKQPLPYPLLIADYLTKKLRSRL